MNPVEIAELIRKSSKPSNDIVTAIKANSNLLDALYRLSFTADLCTGAEIDNLVNELKNHTDEIIVMVGRILEVKKNGYSSKIFQNPQS